MSENKSSKTNFLMGFFVGMAVLAVVAFFTLLIVVFSNKQPVDLGAQAGTQEETEQAAEEPEDQPANPVQGVKENEPFLGGKDAKVVLIEYSDLECPFCLRHHGTIQQIVDEYGSKIKYVLRHFPLAFHPNAQKAAEAAECAAEQGKYFEMVDKVFEANEKKQMGVEAWKTAAKNLGLNSSKFNDCLDSGKYAEKIGKDMQEGASAGVSGTPATFVNGQLVSGALPFESFKQVIDGLLSE